MDGFVPGLLRNLLNWKLIEMLADVKNSCSLELIWFIAKAGRRHVVRRVFQANPILIPLGGKTSKLLANAQVYMHIYPSRMLHPGRNSSYSSVVRINIKVNYRPLFFIPRSSWVKFV